MTDRDTASAAQLIDEFMARLNDAFASSGYGPFPKVTDLRRDLTDIAAAARQDGRNALLTEHNAEKDLIFDDLRAILRALGLFDGARPISGHEVVQSVILPAIKARAQSDAAVVALYERLERFIDLNHGAAQRSPLSAMGHAGKWETCSAFACVDGRAALDATRAAYDAAKGNKS